MLTARKVGSTNRVPFIPGSSWLLTAMPALSNDKHGLLRAAKNMADVPHSPHCIYTDYCDCKTEVNGILKVTVNLFSDYISIRVPLNQHNTDSWTVQILHFMGTREGQGVRPPKFARMIHNALKHYYNHIEHWYDPNNSGTVPPMTTAVVHSLETACSDHTNTVSLCQ